MDDAYTQALLQSLDYAPLRAALQALDEHRATQDEYDDLRPYDERVVDLLEDVERAARNLTKETQP